jgi:hypothetical protein
MKRCIALAMVLPISFTAGATIMPTQLAIPAAAWRADLEVILSELPKRHPNAFHAVSRQAFVAAIQDLEAHAEQQGPDARFVSLSRLISRIGDAHTSIVSPADRGYFPLEIQSFGNDFRVTRTAPGFERALGARVLSIDGIPVRSALSEALELTPVEETPGLRRALASNYLTVGLILHGLGITTEHARARYELQHDGGESFLLQVSGSPARDETGWVRPYTHPMLADEYPALPFWCAQVTAARAVYCDFRGYEGLGQRVPALFQLLHTVKPERLVIDLRSNGGGDYTLGQQQLIEPLRRLPDINRDGHLYVLVGPDTFSAAMDNAAQFRTMTAAVLVGDTIGEKPNSYQEPRELTLPNSHLVLRYSTRWYSFLACGRNQIDPDVHIVPTWHEYSIGVDPVLEYALFGPPVEL